MTQKLPDFFINAFYESKFRDNLFIVKASGAVIEDDKARDTLMADIHDLILQGIKVILIYGFGGMIDAEVDKRGIGRKRDGGRRITDAATLQIIKELVGGVLSLKVTQSMFKNKLDGLNFNSVPSDWLKVVKRPSKPVDFGFVGDIEDVRTRPIHRLLRTADFIACPCLAVSEDGEILNINADTIATDVAAAMKADKLIFLSNVDGVKIKNETAFMVTTDDIPKLIADGTVTDGMKVKMENCLRALQAGVKRIHLINGLRENALYKEIYESVSPGTMVIHESDRQNYLNEIEVQKLIERKAS
jgi:acetylglutamate kinase